MVTDEDPMEDAPQADRSSLSPSADLPSVDDVVAGLTADRETRIETLRQLEANPPEDDARTRRLVTRVADRLDADDASTRKAAATALWTLGDANAASLTPVADELADRLDAEPDPLVRVFLSQALVPVAAAAPEALVPIVPTLADGLESELLLRQQTSVATLSTLADRRPEAVGGVVGQIVTVATRHGETTSGTVGGFDDDADATYNDRHERVSADAAGILRTLADANPDAITPHAAAIAATCGSDVPGDRSRLLAEVLGRVARKNPVAVRPAIEPLSELVRHTDDPELARSATFVLGLLADAFPDETVTAVRSAVPTLTRLLQGGDPDVREPVCSLLSYVAERYPADVEPAREVLLTLLGTDESPVVRAAAGITLSYLAREDETVVALRDAHRADEAAVVRDAAAASLERLQ